MCVRVTERYAGCGCIYYVHGIDACPLYGRHAIQERVVYVGLNCPRHSRRRGLLAPGDNDDHEGNQNGDAPQDPKQPSSYQHELRVYDEKKALASSSKSCKSAPPDLTTSSSGGAQTQSNGVKMSRVST